MSSQAPPGLLNSRGKSSLSGHAKTRNRSLLSKEGFFDENERLRGFSTGFSSIFDGNVTLDPSIRALQEEALTRNRGMFQRSGTALDDFLSKQRGLRTRFEGNRGAFTQALVNPVLQARESSLGATRRQQNLRGITGSSFASGDLASQRRDFATEEGDARAKAEYANLEALTGIDQNMIGAAFQTISQQMALNNETLDVAKTRLAGELQALGLGQQQINTMVQAFEGQQNRAFAERQAIANSIMQGFGKGGGGGGKPGVGAK